MQASLLWLQLGALLAYLGVTWQEYRRVRLQRVPTRRQLLPLGTLAVALHGAALFPQLILPSGALNLNLGLSLSLFAWIVALVLLIASAWRPLAILGLGVMPTAAVVLLGQALFSGGPTVPIRVTDNPLLFGHILVSTTAYALLTLAAGQGVLLWIQDRSLRLKRFGPSFRLLPPLQDMEEVLFQIIWTGFVLLSLSLLSATLFADRIFGRPFVWDHHTVLSLVAWLVFAILLLGRARWGWRARTAVGWTLSGYGIILLAYFGVKIVLEFILQRPS